MSAITKLFPKVLLNEPLSNHTTFKVGGPAEYFYIALTIKDLIKAIKSARQSNTPFIILGNGSNVLVSDNGVKGLVIKNQTSQIKLLSTKSAVISQVSLSTRYTSLDFDLNKIDQSTYNESNYPAVLVQFDSGVFLPKAIFSLINQGITGLEWFAGIPATIGGATFINIHGGKKYWSDYFVSAKILDKNNQVKTVSSDYFKFDYDKSVLSISNEIVLSVILKLVKGPIKKALTIAKTWAMKKSHQPQCSSGCIFQNLDVKTVKLLNLPTPSTGYLIDKKLGLKGKQIGQARIAFEHAGFIENLGSATAKDVIQLIKLIKSTAKSKLGIDLKLEIVPLGFKKELWLN